MARKLHAMAVLLVAMAGCLQPSGEVNTPSPCHACPFVQSLDMNSSVNQPFEAARVGDALRSLGYRIVESTNTTFSASYPNPCSGERCGAIYVNGSDVPWGVTVSVPSPDSAPRPNLDAANETGRALCAGAEPTLRERLTEFDDAAGLANVTLGPCHAVIVFGSTPPQDVRQPT